MIPLGSVHGYAGVTLFTRKFAQLLRTAISLELQKSAEGSEWELSRKSVW